MEDMEKQ